MPITRIGKYLESADLGITNSLGIESIQLESCIREIQKRKILGAFGSPAFGFEEDNVNFFNELPFLKQVWFWEINLKDISGLYALNELEYFGVQDKRPAIDFSKFPKLKKAVWQPVRKDSGLEQLANLRELDVWRFKPKDKSYASIGLPNSLKELELNWCNPVTLDGMPLLDELEELQIHYCRNLETIESIFKFAPNLKRLVITRCANLTNFETVHEREWEHLYINIKGKTIANKALNRTP
jgi:hypothetical protein